MAQATGVRIVWADLPFHVRSGVEVIIGDRVVDAVSQAGGFSPGTADRVETATCQRAFVKAVSPEQNEQSPQLHRQEANVTARLPEDAPVPRLLGCYDDGYWVALVLHDVEGRHPRTPWLHTELAQVLTALQDLAEIMTPSPVPDAPAAAEILNSDFAGWRRISADPPPDLDPWSLAHLNDLAIAADRGLAALTGQTLVHLDVRADNLLMRPDGTGRIQVNVATPGGFGGCDGTGPAEASESWAGGEAGAVCPVDRAGCEQL